MRRLPAIRGGQVARLRAEVERSPIDMEIARLEQLSLDELRLAWRNRWGRLAPAHLPRTLLFRLMAYRIQAEAFGDLDRNSVKALDRLGRDSPAQAIGSNDRSDDAAAAPRKPGRPARAAEVAPLILKPGAVLTREWRGRIETVMALEDGFVWNGQTYPSLSAVAVAITGVKWSGQRFFFGAKGRNGATGQGGSHSPSKSKPNSFDQSGLETAP